MGPEFGCGRVRSGYEVVIRRMPGVAIACDPLAERA
jgi:hypothetical protein